MTGSSAPRISACARPELARIVFTLNLKRARLLGLAIPPSVLQRAIG
jgi:hypothetical protein